MEPLLDVSGVSKRFCRDQRRALRYGVADIAGEFLPLTRRTDRLRPDEFWAVRDASFTIRPGDGLAVIGANGSGKSTLLRLMAGLLKPDTGTIRRTGSMHALTDLGAGLNPLLSGRENVALGLALQGHSARDTPALAERVEAFADIGAFIDAPVHSYSSGMRSRLGFALATQIDAGLLLVDEVLAVGDFAFRQKCIGYFRRHLDGGGALVFVSHNSMLVQTVCNRGLWLDHGETRFAGRATDALDRMYDDQQVAGDVPVAAAQASGGGAEITAVEVQDGESGARFGKPLTVTLDYRLPRAMVGICCLLIWNRDLSVCIAMVSDPDPVPMAAGPGRRTCTIDRLALIAGSYWIRAVILDPATMFPMATLGQRSRPAPLVVQASGRRIEASQRQVGVLMELPSTWE